MRSRPLLLLVATLLACACASEEDLIPTVEHTPLALDPTEEVQIGPWWTNGDQLLHLQADGRYALFAEGNRYRTPVHRGRWDKISYAVIRLQPYDRRPGESIRVSIRREDGELELVLPDLELMRAIDEPPLVIEDRLVGRWESDAGLLTLEPTLRYTYSVRPPGDSDPPGHPGTWEVDGETLILDPTPPLLGPYTLEIDAGEDRLVLRAREGVYRRPKPKPLPQ